MSVGALDSGSNGTLLIKGCLPAARPGDFFINNREKHLPL